MTRNPGSVFTAVSYTSRPYPACEYGIRREELRTSRCCLVHFQPRMPSSSHERNDGFVMNLILRDDLLENIFFHRPHSQTENH
jgi:hypothetical protein